MDPRITIRDETSADIDRITEVTVAAFETLEFADLTEHHIILALREADALTLSLVAELDGCVIGHIAFSPVTVSDGAPNWFGLGPVSVLPEHHGRGIGAALIREGLSRLRSQNAAGCCLVGHPGYYGRFGFESVRELRVEGVSPDVFFALSFDGFMPQGSVSFHEAFRATGDG